MDDLGSLYNQVWKLERGVFDLLLMHRTEMEKDLDSDGVQQNAPTFRFDPEACTISLSGLAYRTENAKQVIQRRFIDAVCMKELKLSLAGIRLKDFNDKECGDVIVNGLQLTYKCSIEVSSHSGNQVEKPKSTRSVPRLAQSLKPVSSNPSKIVVVKGNIVSFAADVLVNTLTTGVQDLSKGGAVAKAFYDVAGTEITQALGRNWPRDFGKDLSVTSTFKQIPTKQIYHVTVAGYRNSESIERLGSQISTCLKRAVADNMTSIAFPAVGCGYLKYDPSDVAEQFLKAERLYGQQLKIFVVVLDDTTFKAIESEISKHQHLADVSFSSVQTSTTRPASLSEVEVTLGTLTDTTADVLVNAITCNTGDLRKAGAVSKCLMDIAGDQLQTEFGNQQRPVNFGKDIAVTSACGLPAKKIYHVAVRARKNAQSDKLLYDTICECLKMAARYRVSSIAFPTIGCGGLNYAPSTVIDCFNRAKRDTGTSCKILVVTPDKTLFKKLCSAVSVAETSKPIFQQQSPSSNGKQRQRRSFSQKFFAKLLPGRASRPSEEQAADQAGAKLEDDDSWDQENTFVFTIRALDSSTVDDVARELPSKLQDFAAKEVVKNEVIDCLGTEIIRRIQDLQSTDVRIQIDVRNKCITLTGKMSSVQDAKKTVEQIVHEQEELEMNFYHIRATKKSEEALRIIAGLSHECYPRYWSQQQPGVGLATRTKHVSLTMGTDLYSQVEQLLTKTWEPSKAGHGSDAQGLSHKNIGVKNIWRIENPILFKKFDTARKSYCSIAAVNPYPTFDGLQGEREVLTRQAGLGLLDENLVSEINEYYLLHGTKEDAVPLIERQGFDFRVNEHGMMGKAIYFAESSTKADQYTDDKNQRIGVNQPLYMFVCRVVLGNVFLSRGVEKYVRPPCSVQNCPSLTAEVSADGTLKQKMCRDESHKQFDSIVVTHKDAKTRFLFREFVIYDNHCYPEFLVEYERLA